MLGQISGVSSPHQNKGNFISIYVCKTFFEVQPQNVLNSNFYILIGRNTWKPQCIQLQLKLRDTSLTQFLCGSNHLQPPPRPLKGCDSPWSDMSIRAVIQIDDILSICVKRDLADCKELDTYQTGNTRCQCVVSDVTKIFHN